MATDFTFFLEPAEREIVAKSDCLKETNRGREYTFEEILPNGKRFGDATGEDLKEAVNFYKRVAVLNARLARMAEGHSNYAAR